MFLLSREVKKGLTFGKIGCAIDVTYTDPAGLSDETCLWILKTGFVLRVVVGIG